MVRSVTGVDLRAGLAAARARGATPGVELAVSVVIQVCDALAPLHAAGLVHGELRPERVIVWATGAVRLFGDGDRPGATTGEPAADDPEEPIDDDLPRRLRYVAPEQVLGTPGGAAADVWAAAVVAIELATGAHPIAADVCESTDILKAVLAGIAPPRELPEAIRAALGRALEHDPARRPGAAALGTALAMAAASDGLAFGPGVIARDHAMLEPLPPAAPRLGCWCARLAAGLEAEAASAALMTFVHEDLVRERSLGSTVEHFGDVSLCRCRRCAGAVGHLLIEHEGFTGSIHHYYTPLTTTDEAALASGRLSAASYEAWAGDRGGIHVADGRATTYRSAQIGYLGLDHRLRS